MASIGVGQPILTNAIREISYRMPRYFRRSPRSRPSLRGARRASNFCMRDEAGSRHGFLRKRSFRCFGYAFTIIRRQPTISSDALALAIRVSYMPRFILMKCEADIGRCLYRGYCDDRLRWRRCRHRKAAAIWGLMTEKPIICARPWAPPLVLTR